MGNLTTKAGITFVMLCLIFDSVISASLDYHTQIEISSKNKNIRIGEPLIIKVTYKFEKPQYSNRADTFYTSIGPHATVQIKKDDEEILTQGYHLGPGVLYLQDTEGLEYSGDFLLFYNLLKNNLIFNTPAVYTITVRRTRTTISNTLNITVEPATDVNRQALSLLSETNDYFLLEFGETKDQNTRREGLLHLKQVFEQSKDALLSKWAAARLGLEYFEDLQKKYPSFQKFKADLQQGKVKEPLFEQACMFLAAGTKLPDEFPIRQQVLYEMSATEYIKNNYEKAFSLLDELCAKYPTGKYSKRALSGKEELQEIQERESGQSPNPALGQSQGRIALPIVSIAVIAGIALIVLIIVFKKKPCRGK